PAKTEIKETAMKTEARVPEGAAVLNVFTRIDPLPAGLGADDLNRSVGRDHLWILKDEVQAIVNALKDSAEAPLPAALAKRLAQFHLIDNVRGEPDMWESKHILKGDFKLTRISAGETL